MENGLKKKRQRGEEMFRGFKGRFYASLIRQGHVHLGVTAHTKQHPGLWRTSGGYADKCPHPGDRGIVQNT